MGWRIKSKWTTSYVDTPSRTSWEDEDDDGTPLKRSSWDLPTPSSRDSEDRSERSFSSSFRGSKDRRYKKEFSIENFLTSILDCGLFKIWKFWKGERKKTVLMILVIFITLCNHLFVNGKCWNFITTFSGKGQMRHHYLLLHINIIHGWKIRGEYHTLLNQMKKVIKFSNLLSCKTLFTSEQSIVLVFHCA